MSDFSSALARYESKVDRLTTPDGCHLWTSTTNWAGYGILRVGSRLQLAHRLGYQHYVGPIPSGLIVRHSCDVPPCQNPKHLLTGTQADNVADMMSRGRYRPRGKAKKMGGIPVNGEVLKALREANGYTSTEFAELIGIDRTSLSNIERGHRNASPKVLQQMADALKVKRTVIRKVPGDE